MDYYNIFLMMVIIQLLLPVSCISKIKVLASLVFYLRDTFHSRLTFVDIYQFYTYLAYGWEDDENVLNLVENFAKGCKDCNLFTFFTFFEEPQLFKR